MSKYIYIIALVALGMVACTNKKDMMTKEEITLIQSESADIPFYVLQTTEKLDSLFLRLNAKDIEIEDIASNVDLQLLIKRMRVTLTEEVGVGLAAPQVGISRNLFLFMRIDKEENPIQVAINPKIVTHADSLVCFEGDGCLSIPDEGGDTARYPWIEVEYYNEKGELIKERLSGYSRETDFTGVIFQHEFDHLQGILFTDKIFSKTK